MRQFNQRITKIITNRKKKHHFTFSCQYKYISLHLDCKGIYEYLNKNINYGRKFRSKGAGPGCCPLLW